MGIDCGKDGLTVVACLKDVSVFLPSVCLRVLLLAQIMLNMYLTLYMIVFFIVMPSSMLF